MGVCYTSKAFEITKTTEKRMSKEHYYIDMERGCIIFDDEIEYYVNWYVDLMELQCWDGTQLTWEEKLEELSIVDCDYTEEYCYGMGKIYTITTSSGDVVCIVNYAY